MKQIVNAYYKCIALITEKGFIIPTHPSKSLLDVEIIYDYPTKLKPFSEVRNTMKALKEETGLLMKVAFLVPDLTGTKFSSVLLEYDGGKFFVPVPVTKIDTKFHKLIYTSDIEVDQAIRTGKGDIDARVVMVKKKTLSKKHMS